MAQPSAAPRETHSGLLTSARALEKLREIVGQRSLDIDDVASVRMSESHAPRVQRDAAAADSQRRIFPARVLALSHQWKAGVREVHADLVVATCDEIDVEHGRLREPLERSIASHG